MSAEQPRTIPELEQLIADLEEDIARPWPPKRHMRAWAARELTDHRDRRLLELAQELLTLRRVMAQNGLGWGRSGSSPAVTTVPKWAS